MSAEENKEKVRCLYEEAFGRGKPEVIDEVLHSDYVCYDPNSETGEIRGAQTVKGEIEYFRSAFPDFFWRVEDQIAEALGNTFDRPILERSIGISSILAEYRGE